MAVSISVSLALSIKERARKREIASYLDAASIPARVGPPQQPAALCRDPTLNALVQLGSLRLDTDRSFLSLIDGEYQYVVAETTKTLSLVNSAEHAANDGLYIGVSKLELGWGVCPNTIRVFTDETGKMVIKEANVVADRTRYIISDFRIDERYQNCPYVKGFPHMISYAEVPLVSPTGYVLGSYCVVDNKKRDFDNDATIAVLTEIAACVMSHLDLKRMQQGRARSEKLIKGLGVFMGRTVDGDPKNKNKVLDGLPSASSLAPPSTIDLQEETVSIKTDVSQAGGEHASELECEEVEVLPRPSPSNNASESTISTQFSGTFSIVSTSEQTPNGTASETPLSTPPPASSGKNPFEEEANAVPTPPFHDDEEEAAKPNVLETLVSADVRSAFSRAATLIKDAMHMDGLTFVDACLTGFASRSHHPTPQERGDPFLSDSTDHSDDESTPGESATLGSSLKVTSRNNGDCNTLKSDHPVGVPEALLHRIIRKYPRGAVFSADQEGFIDEGDSPYMNARDGERSGPKRSRISLDLQQLFRAIPGARSIIFLPLWHFQNESWFAGTIGWTADPTKAFERCDLIYLSAFGNSVMAEVSRYEALAVSRSKSDFISSVSHELRSPLHGILASAELLRDSIEDPSQLHMLDMIESCGSTLLDTMNHILDFAKINTQIASPQGKPVDVSLPTNPPLLATVDLGLLVQDVVEAVYIGQNSRPMFRNGGLMSSAASPAAESNSLMLEGQELPVLVTLQVQHDAPWEMDIEVGAWKRIVMNLFGNALKYTRSGHIQVGLSVVSHADKSGEKRDTVCFSVVDTGIGMSSDYLKYRLFTPFAQENNLSTGTGLGLSIVKQIVNDLGGDLDVQSQIGVGTRMRVFVPLPERVAVPATSPSLSPPSGPPTLLDPQRKLNQKAIYVIDPSNHSPRAELSLELRNAKHTRARAVKATLDDIAPTWLGTEVVLAGDDVDSHADFYFVDWSVIDALSMQQLQIIMKSPKWKPLIILCYGPPSNRIKGNLGERNVVYLRHPIGPKKLAAALLSGLDGMAKSPQAPPSVPAVAEPAAESEKLSLGSGATSPNSGSKGFSGRAPGPTGLTVPLPAPMPVSHTPRHHLLLVDDNDINLKILTTLVKKLGCTFEAATNGLEAVQRFKASAKPFNFIFMDITMPVMNGFAATSEIRAFERTNHMQPTKVIALTGLGSAVSQQEAYSSGADLFLTKPVSMKALRGLLAGDDGGVVAGGVGSPSGSAPSPMGGFPFTNMGAGAKTMDAVAATAAAVTSATTTATAVTPNLPPSATTITIKAIKTEGGA